MQLLTGVVVIESVQETLAVLEDLATRYDTTIQAFDGRYVAGRTHLERAIRLADRAIERDGAIARDRGVEILLYAAGRRQIDQALEMGIAEGDGPVVILVDGGAEDQTVASLIEAFDGTLERQSSIDTGDPETIQQFFEIATPELEATAASLEDLVCERVALLAVDR